MSITASPTKRWAAVAAAVAFAVAGVALTSAIPAVEGLGEKVRLPMFHGGSTWVNMATFTLMGVFGAIYYITEHKGAYGWMAGFMAISAPLWLANTVMGVIAAASTWDFSGSKQSPIGVIWQDPRLTAQFWLLLGVGGLLIAVLTTQSRRVHALAAIAYTALMWVLLGTVMWGPARALHPDNPVLNSGLDIQVPFFSIVACVFAAAVLGAWLVRDRVAHAEVARLAEESETAPER
ncbi:MAG: hypothetical protein Q8K99_10715 [Actinomycetota bacterium]|nr:hypothetical protein [Actinomycetota bacterium]